LSLFEVFSRSASSRVSIIGQAAVVLGLDDTIERRRGKRISAKGIYRDPVRGLALLLRDHRACGQSGEHWRSRAGSRPSEMDCPVR
jgi:hypothetical protein